jgi:hypothetical protein
MAVRPGPAAVLKAKPRRQLQDSAWKWLFCEQKSHFLVFQDGILGEAHSLIVMDKALEDEAPGSTAVRKARQAAKCWDRLCVSIARNPNPALLRSPIRLPGTDRRSDPPESKQTYLD